MKKIFFEEIARNSAAAQKLQIASLHESAVGEKRDRNVIASSHRDPHYVNIYNSKRIHSTLQYRIADGLYSGSCNQQAAGYSSGRPLHQCFNKNIAKFHMRDLEQDCAQSNAMKASRPGKTAVMSKTS